LPSSSQAPLALSGSEESAQAITMEEMIKRFANGIIAALSLKRPVA
jgi:hypothetical protein